MEKQSKLLSLRQIIHLRWTVAHSRQCCYLKNIKTEKWWSFLLQELSEQASHSSWTSYWHFSRRRMEKDVPLLSRMKLTLIANGLRFEKILWPFNIPQNDLVVPYFTDVHESFPYATDPYCVHLFAPLPPPSNKIYGYSGWLNNDPHSEIDLGVV